jgi:hypothetical protein
MAHVKVAEVVGASFQRRQIELNCKTSEKPHLRTEKNGLTRSVTARQLFEPQFHLERTKPAREIFPNKNRV